MGRKDTRHSQEGTFSVRDNPSWPGRARGEHGGTVSQDADRSAGEASRGGHSLSVWTLEHRGP